MKDNNKKIGLVIFYVIVFIYIIFALGNRDNKDSNVKQKEDDKKTVVEVRNYSFKHIINKNIELSGKVYGNKVLTSKIEKGEVTNYYQNGANIYIEKDNKFIKYDGKIIEKFDMNLINIAYIDSIVEKSVIKSKTVNSVLMYNQNTDMTIEFIYDMNGELDKTIINKDDTTVESKYYDVDKIKDFNVLTK